MKTSSIPESLRGTIYSTLAGNRDVARADLERLLPSVPEQASAWVLYAWLADSPQTAIASLSRALSIDPASELALAGLIWAEQFRDWAVESAIEYASPDSHDEGQISVEDRPLEGGGHDTDCMTDAEIDQSVGAPRVDGDGIEQDLLHEVESIMDDHVANDTPSVDDSQPGEGRPQEPVAEEPVAETDSQRRPLVFVIDHSPTIRKLASITLQRVGYEVVTAADGVAALNLLAEQKPVLILTDINMPRMSGYRFCKLVKKHAQTEDIPVILLSGKKGVFDRVRGQMAGCADYIAKPFESYDLINKVRAHALSVKKGSTLEIQ